MCPKENLYKHFKSLSKFSIYAIFIANHVASSQARLLVVFTKMWIFFYVILVITVNIHCK